MNAVDDLLLELDRLDVKLWAEGGRLRYSAPQGVLGENLISRLRTHKAELLPRVPLSAPSKPPAIPRVPRDHELQPSFGQERLWFLQQLEGAAAAYNVPSAVRIRGPLDLDRARSAIAGIVQRHEVLRTRFPGQDGRCTVVVEPQVTIDLPVIAADEGDIERHIRHESLRKFDLAQAPLFRATVLRLAPHDHVVILNLHHIVSDGWSSAIFVSEFCRLYQGGTLPPLSIQYADYAAYQRRRHASGHSAGGTEFFARLLDGAPAVLDLMGDRPRPGVQSFQGGSVPVEVSAGVSSRLRALGHQANATPYMTLLACFAGLLHRYSRQSKVVIGSPAANRQSPEIEPLIGFFLNTLVLPVDASGNPTFQDFLARVRQLALDVLARQDTPFEHLVEALQPARTLSHSPLFQTMFILQNNRSEPVTLAGLEVTAIEVPQSTEKFDLTLSLAESGAGPVRGQLGYSSDLFDESTAARIAAHFVNFVTAAIADPGQRLDAIPILSANEHREIVCLWNDTARPRPPSLLIHQMVEQQAARSPHAVALVYEDATLSYAEFNARANRLAHRLISLGAGPETRVGICIDRSFEMMVALLAVLKAGGAYVPLDTSYPAARLAFMLDDSDVAVLLTTRSHQGLLPAPAVPVLYLDEDSFAGEREDNPGVPVSPDNLAYIIYTSGSTGRPKGVMNAHRGVVNRLLWGQETFSMQPDDCLIQKTPIGFDVSVWEMFWPLFTGARLVIAKPGGHKDSAYLVDLIERHGVTMIHFVAPMLGSFLEEDMARCRTLRRVLTSGEALSLEMQRRYFNKLPVPLDDLYGPTEAAIEVSHWQCQPASPLRLVPIGRPISNIQLYILDQCLQPVPIGVPGELYIGGAGVARGYWKRPSLTAGLFIPDPFSSIPGSRLYRTGDAARFLPDGNIDFLGRLDQQIKIRGFRVELGEIEHALEALAGVRDAAVLYRDHRLVAYVITAGAPLVEADLRERLSRTLPSHMVPAHFVFLNAFPIAPNGKLNRAALPPPLVQTSDETSSRPLTNAEAALARIWADVLGLDRVGIYDDFFAIGGDSISSTRIVARARRAGWHITLKQVFQHHTVAALASVAEPLREVTVHAPAARTGPIPLTPIEDRFLASAAGPRHYNQAVLLEVTPGLDTARLSAALARLVERHDALRLRFHRDNGEWLQIVDDAPPPDPILLRFPVEELPQRAAELQSSIDPENGPIFLAAYFDGGPLNPGRLLLIGHHLAVDGVSWRILLADLSQLLSGGSLPERASVSFADWAHWLAAYRNQTTHEAGYWRNLAGRAFPELPVEFSLGANTIASVEIAELSIEAPPVPHLHEALLSSLVDALCTWTCGDRILVDLEAHGRGELPGCPDVTETVGWFTSAFPAAFSRPPSPALAISLLRHEFETIPLRGAAYGLLELTDSFKPEVAFNYLGRFEESPPAAGPILGFAAESAGPMISPAMRRSHKFEVTALVSAGRLRVTWAYSRNLHSRKTVETLLHRMIARLQALAAESSRSLIESACPLSPSQLGILLASLAQPASGTYVEQCSWRLRGLLDSKRLEAAVQFALERHSALRTAFLWDVAPQPLQYVQREVTPYVRFEDWRLAADRSVEDFVLEDRRRGFALDRPPLFRLTALQTAETEWHLVATYHHLVLDGWSLPLVLGDIMAAYQGHMSTEASIPYASYITWLARQDVQAAAAFWRGSLASFRRATAFAIPDSTDRAVTFTEFSLDGTATARLESVGRAAQVTLNTVLQACWALTLHWWSREDDVLFGQTVSGRPASLKGVDTIAGMFVNTIPVRCRISQDQPVTAWLQSIQVAQSDAEVYSWCSAAQIHGWAEVPPSQPLYESLLVVENYPHERVTTAASSGLDVMSVQASGAQTGAALTLLAGPGTRLTFRAISRPERWGSQMLHRLLVGFQQMLQRMALSESHHRLADLLTGMPAAPVHPAAAEPQSERATAPRTVEELRLAAIWEDVLGVPRVAMHDNFFEMGGHSLLALHLVERIQQEFGRSIPLSTLVQAPTVEALAGVLTSMPARFSALVPLRRSAGEQTPLFCIHPLGGSVLCYAGLARMLDSSRPVYGLQARGIDEGDLPAPEIDAMAAEYVEAIRLAQPHGPYLLLGYSFGGYVAMRMAVLLHQCGESVERVFLLDVPHPSVVPPEMARNDESGLLVSLFAGSLDLDVDDLRTMNAQDRLHHVFDRAREAGIVPPGMPFERAARHFAIARANHAMNVSGTLTCPFPVTQVRASDQANRISVLPDLGWRDYAASLDLIWTPGMHETMLNPPHVERLAALISRALAPIAQGSHA